MVKSEQKNQLGPSTKKQNNMSLASEKAYTKIKTALLTGELKHGENLSERDLAARIGMSRTPVREAINRLRYEGLVLLERNSRNYVAHFSQDDLEEILDLRALLEGYAAAQAVHHITAEDIAKLNDLATKMENAVADININVQEAYYPLNEEFHDIIIQAAKNSRIESILNTILSNKFHILARVEQDEVIRESFKHSCIQHREIISALESKSEDRAMSQMRAHLLSLLKVESLRRDTWELNI